MKEIECPVCHERYNQINSRHLRKHGFPTIEEFRKVFGEYKLISDETRKKAGIKIEPVSIKQRQKYDETKRLFREAYEASPKKCKGCSNQISFDSRGRDYCSYTCDTKRYAKVASEEQKLKVSQSMRKYAEANKEELTERFRRYWLSDKAATRRKHVQIIKDENGVVLSKTYIDKLYSCIECKCPIHNNKSKKCKECYTNSSEANLNRGRTRNHSRGHLLMRDGKEFYYMSSFEKRFLDKCNAIGLEV